MLFVSIYRAREGVTEEAEKRLQQLFMNWTPPDGFDIKAHYGFADGSGGVLIVEASSASALAGASSPWGPYIEIKTIPAVDVAEGVAIAQKVYAWRDSVR